MRRAASTTTAVSNGKWNVSNIAKFKLKYEWDQVTLTPSSDIEWFTKKGETLNRPYGCLTVGASDAV
jgi:hypothetical protein